MKKLVILIMFAFTSIFTYATDTIPAKVIDTQTPVLDKTEHLVDKYSAKIADLFIASIDKASPFVKTTFTSLVYLQIGRGVAYLIPTILFLLFLYLFITQYNKIDNILKSGNVPKNLDSNYGVFSEYNVNPIIITTLVIMVVCGITSIFTIVDAIEHLFAPQWFAVKDIIDIFKK